MREYRLFWTILVALLAGLVLLGAFSGKDIRDYVRSEVAFAQGVRVLQSPYPEELKLRLAGDRFAEARTNSLPSQALDLRIARAYTSAGFPRVAIPFWREAVGPKSDLPVLLEAGQAAFAADDEGAVEAFFSEAIRRFPSHPEAYNSLGYYWADRGIRLPEAEQLIRTALDLLHARKLPASDLAEAAYLDSLGWVHFRQGRLEEAMAELSRAHDMLPQDPEIAHHYREAKKRMTNDE